MTTSVFGQSYAGQYDLLYQNKDYQAECDLLEEIFRSHTAGPVKTILDLGCGTGSHAIPLAKRGYKVSGVDISEDMLALAKKKSEGCPSPAPEFFKGDVRQVDLGRQFDAVIMMFAVLGYQLTNNDVLNALATVRKHLRPGGLFVCDVWYGPAVLTIRPSERVKIIPTDDGKLIRVASGALDTYRHLCEVRYNLWRLSGNKVVSETQESHMMRYFFPQELAILFKHSGLNIADIRGFDGRGLLPPDENTWNIVVTGTKGE